MSYTEEFPEFVSPWGFIADKVDYKLIFYPLLHVTYLRSWHGAIKPENIKIISSTLCQGLPFYSSFNPDPAPNPDPGFRWPKIEKRKIQPKNFFSSGFDQMFQFTYP